MLRLKFMVMFCLLSLVIFSGEILAAVQVRQPAPDFTLTDSNGQVHSLSDYRGQYVVLEWVNYQCPFVIKHYRSHNMQNLQKKYAAKGVVWLSINSSAPGKQGNYPPAEINQIMANSKASPAAYLIDESGDVGHLYGAQATPHMFVIDPKGILIYQGAIDSVPSADIKDIAKAQNYVAAALDQDMAGDPVTTPATKSYGCAVKY